jgi:hypothetical protein
VSAAASLKETDNGKLGINLHLLCDVRRFVMRPCLDNAGFRSIVASQPRRGEKVCTRARHLETHSQSGEGHF